LFYLWLDTYNLTLEISFIIIRFGCKKIKFHFVIVYGFLIDNLLEKRTFLLDGKEYIEIGSNNILWSPSFRLYFTTKEEDASTNFELTSKVRPFSDIPYN